MMYSISLRNIKKNYLVDGKSIPVLDNLSLDIPEGKITVVLGRSGCGKTTLLRITGELEKADEGKIIQSQSMKINEKMSFVFQEPRLMPWLNVWENVEFGIGSVCDEKKRFRRKKFQDDHVSRNYIQKQIEKVGLNGFEKAYPHQLSGGMQQRAAIARAFAYRPSMILMDEPFAALDYFTRNQMQMELIRLQKESCVSILFVTHSIDEALLLGHKIVILEKGQMKSEIENNQNDNLIIQKKRIMEQLKV